MATPAPSLLAGEGIWWSNPLDGAEIERSDFTRLFIEALAAESIATRNGPIESLSQAGLGSTLRGS